jgi:predicted translin family RNA/ssDNA-binding protein
MYTTITTLLDSIVPDLQGMNTHRYRQNITGGIQEYMEAVTFQFYLEHQRVMTFEEAASTLPQGLLLTYDDYVLGLFDMTGELMRFAITYMATNGRLPSSPSLPDNSTSSSILTDMQTLRSELEKIGISNGRGGLAKDFEQKLKVTRQSVEKVENGVYQMIVRGKERPKGWRPDAVVERGGEGDAVETY